MEFMFVIAVLAVVFGFLGMWIAVQGSGKRDRYDIDNMGSFGLRFGDATNSAGQLLVEWFFTS